MSARSVSRSAKRGGRPGLKARLVRIAIARFAGRDLRRWAIVFVGRRALRTVRSVMGREPEVIYQTKLARKGGDLAVRTSRPLPRAQRNKSVQRALQAAYQADVDAVLRPRRR